MSNARTRRIEDVEIHEYGQALSPRQIEVLRCFEEGLSYQQTADRLGIARATVNQIASKAYAKLNAKGIQALAIAREHGLLEPRPPADPDEITPHEMDVLRCMSAGLCRNHTAEELGVTRLKLDFAIGRLYKKLGARNQFQALAIADERGLLDSPAA